MSSASSAAAAEQLLSQLKSVYSPSTTITKGDAHAQQAVDIIKQIKLHLLNLHLTPPFPQDQIATIRKQLLIARLLTDMQGHHT